MFMRFCQFFYLLNLMVIQIKCNNLYVHPKTVYVSKGLAGGKIAISCLDGHAATFATGIEWIKLNTLSIISSDPQARVRRDGHRLLFDSTDHSDEGLYCCRNTAENRGCTYNSSVRILVAKTIRAPAKSLMSNSDSRHNIVAKSTASGWRLEAAPKTRCILLGNNASINCLNNTHSFAENIQWFKILSNGGLQLIPHSRTSRITSNAHQLQFIDTTAEDEGLYCCKTFSEIECSPTAVANVTISLPPALSTLQNHTVLLGETIAINCTINITMGEYTTFSWQKNGKDLPNELRYSTTSSNNGTTLIIINATTADQGYFNCIAKNRKYQQNNQSMYLHVQNPLGCSDINTSYSITVGLQSSRNCSITEKPEMYNIINKFLQSICNCSDYCLTLDDINCSPDDTIITIVMTLKEKKSLFLRSLVYSTLERQVKVDQNYSIFCVVKTLCEKQFPPITTSPKILDNTSATTSEVPDENNGISLVIVIVISSVIVIMLLILVLLIIVAIILRSRKCKQKTKQNSQTTTLRVTSPVQLTSQNITSNERPSTSSNESGFHSSSDCKDSGSPVSDSTDDPFLPNTIYYTDNPNTNLPNECVRTNPSFPTVRSTITPSSTKDNKLKTTKTANSASKHHVQSVNQQENIRWKQNKTYAQLNLYNSAPYLYMAPAPVSNDKPSKVTGHFYDDIEGMNKSTQGAATSQIHHKTKHPHPRPITQHPSSAVYSNNVSPVNGGINISGNGAKLSLKTYKHISSSQV